jgi:rhodanese-related sulfurtransferase
MSQFLARLPEFLGNHIYLSLGFAGVLIALAALEVQRLRRGFRALTPAGATHLINREDALVFDFSALADYENGHIPGARHVAMSQFDPESKDLAKVKSLPVLVYCGSGQTSAGAAKRLVKAGFEKVHWLDGGLRMWKEAQLPLVKGSSRG